MDYDFVAPTSIVELSSTNNCVTPDDVIRWRLIQDRVIFIDYSLDDDDCSDGLYNVSMIERYIFDMNMRELSIPKEQLKPIYVYISSYGGSLDAGFRLVDLFMASRIPIVTIANGAAMSAAFLIFLSGQKRYVFKHSQLLCHQGQVFGISGNAKDVEEATKNYKQTIDKMKVYILDRTSIPEKVFNKNRNKDWYLTEGELLEYGICDKIINSFSDIVEIDPYNKPALTQIKVATNCSIV